MKRFIALLMALCILLCACSAGGQTQQPAADENSVLDGAGQLLEIPENIDEYSISTVYAVSVPFIVALGLSDRVTAVNVKSKFWTEADEHLAAAGTVGRGTVDLEALAELAPTVLIHRSNDPKTVEAVKEKLGLEVFCITVESLDDIKSTLASVGKYFGKEDRVQEVSDWMDSKFAMMESLVESIPPEERKTALLMGGELGRIAGGDMLQSWMIEKVGGICVADEVENNRNWVNVGVETIFEWDPEYLFLTSSTALDYSIDGIEADPTWSGLAAVKNGHVYQMPAKIDTWDMPGISCVLGAMYMLHCMYPELMDAEMLQNEIDEYYSFMFGKTFDPDYLGYSLD